MISPNGGESWATGTFHAVRWTYTGTVGAYVRIELLKSGVLNRTLTTAAPIGASGTGTFNWTIPTTQVPGADYAIRVTSTTNAAYQDSSDSSFRITGPGITVLTPNGEEQWRRGTLQTIRWSYSGAVGTYVRVQLYKGGVLNRYITSATPVGTGAYNWTIPATRVAGTDYKIVVTSTTYPSYTDQSDANFSISP